MKLDLGDGERSYKVYLSRIVGIDLDTRRVDDPGAAERFILGDGAGRTSGVVRLLRPADVTVPGAGTAQPGPDLPHLGANLPSRVTAAIDDGLSRAYHRDGDDWRRANGRPSEREHFHPGYPLEVRDPSTDERINVVAYLSKQPNPSFAAPPNRPEEARLVTLYDETNGRAFSFIGISMPSGVTLPG